MSSVVSRFPMDRDPLRPPPAPGMGRGLALALVAHVLLVVGLSFGVSWRSTPVPAMEAELWSAVPQAAAPKEQLPPEEPTPVKPEPKPEPPKPQQPTAQEVQAQRDAEIAIAKAKERKLKEQEEQREAEDKKRKLEQQKKDEAEKQERDRKEAARKEQADKAKAEKARKDAEAKAEGLRQENIKRMMGMAGATGAPNATGSALKSSGPSANYAGRIKARVRPNIIYADPGGAANPEADVEVRCGPDGTIVARRIVKSSGLPDFDAAVLRALDKTEVLPRDTDGTVPRVMIITFRPRE